MWVVLPLKALSPVKSRLAPVLSPDQREGLMKAMIGDVLAALQNCPHVEGILLVSRDPNVPALAAEYGAEILNLEKDEDLNSAVNAASDHLLEKGVKRALILHGDIERLDTIGLSARAGHQCNADNAAGENSISVRTRQLPAASKSRTAVRA